MDKKESEAAVFIVFGAWVVQGAILMFVGINIFRAVALTFAGTMASFMLLAAGWNKLLVGKPSDPIGLIVGTAFSIPFLWLFFVLMPHSARVSMPIEPNEIATSASVEGDKEIQAAIAKVPETGVGSAIERGPTDYDPSQDPTSSAIALGESDSLHEWSGADTRARFALASAMTKQLGERQVTPIDLMTCVNQIAAEPSLRNMSISSVAAMCALELQ